MGICKSSDNRFWMIIAFAFVAISFILLIAIVVLIALAVKNGADDVGVCGAGDNPNGNVIDLSDPLTPDVFHDLTENELVQLRAFLEKDPQIKAAKVNEAKLSSSYIFAADLFLPSKQDVLLYLDQKTGQQPERRARVMMFRGDLSTPMIEEYLCGPLPNVTSCVLMQLKGRRNPAEFSLRPFNDMEFGVIIGHLLAQVEKQLGYILKESYQTTFFDCGEDGICLSFTPSPLGTSLAGDINRRRLWLSSTYDVEFRTLHPLNFAILLNLDGSDSSQWAIDKVWYAGKIYNSMDDLIVGYNSSSIPVARVTKPVFGPQLYSTLMLKGEPVPKNPQRPPRLVEPDGHRYSVKHRKVEYLNWSFNFRMSSFSGPVINDVRYKGERIAYEIALQEIAVFYSGHSPHPQTTDYVDSGGLLGTNAKVLVPGADCPETSTFVPTIFMAQKSVNVARFPTGMCLFEQNDGVPMRRKLAYDQRMGGFYGGIMNSALVLRSIIAVGNYDYVVDFLFYQTGAMQTRVFSTGYISGVYYEDYERDYAYKIHDRLGGSLHHHMLHFKADLDISGTSNRYETIDFTKADISMTAFPSKPFEVNKFTMNLKENEQEAVYKYNFDTPKYHVIHNNKQQSKFNTIKAYRIQLNSMSKQLLSEGKYNEKTIAWARNQMAVTKHKDHEFWSSSSYAAWDSADPVMDFSQFYSDNDNITDEDLVLWVTMGMHHLPHTEDMPLTTTVGNELSFYLLPYNYFPQCPSVSSRDAIRVELKDRHDRTKGVVLSRYQHQDRDSQCTFPKSNLKDELEQNPDSVLESKYESPAQ